jgi:hypothetical protein
VSETATSLLRPYGGQHRRLRLPTMDACRSRAPQRFLCRQEALVELRIPLRSLLPAVAEALEAGAGRHLTALHLGLYTWPAMEEAVAVPLAALFRAPPADLLPNLEELQISSEWAGLAAFDSLLNALAPGASPRLRKVGGGHEPGGVATRARHGPLLADAAGPPAVQLRHHQRARAPRTGRRDRPGPALVELDLSENPLTDDGVQQFVWSLMPLDGAAPSLQILNLDHTRCGDRGIEAVVSALRGGLLGVEMRELRFADRDGEARITDASAFALANALWDGGAYVSRLQILEVVSSHITMRGKEALVRAAAEQCPTLAKLVLGSPPPGLRPTQHDRLCALMARLTRRKKRILVFKYVHLHY